MIEVRDALGDLAGEWDELVDRSPRPTPFLRSWWLGAVRVADPRFVIVREHGQLIGGGAFAMDRRHGVSRCHLLGEGPLAPHGLDGVALPGREDDVGGALAEWCDDAAGIVDLRGADANGVVARQVPSHAMWTSVGGAPWLQVPATFDEFLGSRTSKLRREIKRVRRRLGERGFEYHEIPEVDAPQALDTFMRLHLERWGDESGIRSVMDALRRALDQGTRAGEVVFQEVSLGDRVVVTLVSLEIGNRSYWYQFGRSLDPECSNAGTLLKSHAVERSCRLGHSLIDFGMGTAATKLVWADDAASVKRVVWATGRFGQPKTKAMMALRRLRRGSASKST